MYACLMHGVPFAQVRAVSNIVERRNRARLEAGRSARAARRSRRWRILDRRMKLSLGFSPCPNDCFMFDAIVNRRIDLEGLEFAVRLADVEALNKAAFAGEARRHEAELSRLRVLRRSLRAARRRQRARPQLRTAADLEARDLDRRGGRRRSAHRHSRASTRRRTSCSASRSRARATRPSCCSRRSSRRCSTGEFDAGLIIHENRFTYEAKGLKKIVDLGEFWEARDRRADSARRHRHQPLAAGRREARGEPRAAAQRRVRVRAPRRRACRSCASTPRR